LSLFYENGFSKRWELFYGRYFLFLIFLLFLEIETKETKDKNAREKGDLNSICLFCLYFMKMDSPNTGSHFMGAISWEPFLVFIFPFLFEDRDKRDKGQGKERWELFHGSHFSFLFFLLF